MDASMRRSFSPVTLWRSITKAIDGRRDVAAAVLPNVAGRACHLGFARRRVTTRVARRRTLQIVPRNRCS
ncbi:hypothetical protein BGLA2_1510025 [Burkholderia gladioli]|nr:hypothetical protein BGLA2_1510025 [Burkholderia gladioli]